MSYRSFVAALALMIAPGALMAQQDSTQLARRMPDAAQRLDNLKQRLNLTPDQLAAIKPILQAEVDSFTAIRERYAGKTERPERRAMMGEYRKVRDDANTKIKPLLTEAQQAEWKKWKDENRAKMREGMKKQRSQGS